MGASEIISLLGGIALFLFGMAIMGDGLKNVVILTVCIRLLRPKKA